MRMSRPNGRGTGQGGWTCAGFANCESSERVESQILSASSSFGLHFILPCMQSKPTRIYRPPTIFDTPLSATITTSTQCTFLSHHERTRQYDTDLNPLCISLMCFFFVFFPHFFLSSLFTFCVAQIESTSHISPKTPNQPTIRHI
jgi:hypothetical protein